MGGVLRKQAHKPSSSHSMTLIMRSITILLLLSLLFTSFILLDRPWEEGNNCLQVEPKISSGSIDLRDAKFPWNKLEFGSVAPKEKLKLAVFSKSWPMGASPGGMERHASTLYTALSLRGHHIHVYTAPSDRLLPHPDIHQGTLHVHFAANDHGSVNCSLAFEMFYKESLRGGFDYVHSESVSLPHWRAKTVPRGVAVTWHGIWYEIMHSKLFQRLLNVEEGEAAAAAAGHVDLLRDAMPRLVDEIAFFPSYTHHICISNSAAHILTTIYQIPDRNVHVILNGVDEAVFSPDPEAGACFRERHGVPADALVMGVAGRLVHDKGHPLLHEAFSKMGRPTVFLLVAGQGPWGNRYAELGRSVKVLGPLHPSELSAFYNAIDVFVNPTLRPQGLDLTLIEAMHCGKPVVTPNYPSITGTVLVRDDFGYTFSPNVESLVGALEKAIGDGVDKLRISGAMGRDYVLGLFTARKMASAYERFFLCMKDHKYCKYPLPTDPA